MKSNRLNAQTILDRLSGHPESKDAGDKPLCCISTMGKNLKFCVDQKSGTSDIIAVFNTTDIDSDREVVIPSGLDPKYFRANGKIFVDHIYASSHTVGWVRWLKEYPSKQDHQQWRARVGIHSTDLGRDIMTIAQESGQFGFSIGFWPTDHGRPTDDEIKLYTQNGVEPESIVRAGEWFETSATPFPCNVNCQGVLSVAAEAEEKAFSALDDLLRKGSIRRETAKMYGLPDAKRKSFRILTDDGSIVSGTREA